MSVFLIGYRGCGKTTVGKRLADRLWQPFVDSDDMVVRQAGKNIKAIFEEDGEKVFRDRESKVLRELAMLDEHIIALGGGAPVREENRIVLRDGGHKVIYMKCSAEELWRRIGSDPESSATRPDLTPGGGLAEVRKMMAEREPLYRECMSAELDVTHLSPQDACTYIARLL